MRMRRRDFVTMTGAAYLAGCAPHPVGKTASTGQSASARIEPGDWEAVRREFDQDPSYVNLTGFLLMPNPRLVREAITAHRAELDRNPVLVIEHQLTLSMSGKDSYESLARKAAAGFLATAPEEIALTDSTTMGLGLVYSGFRLAPGKEALISSQSHYSTFEAFRLRAARDGVQTRVVGLYSDPSNVTIDEVVSKLRAALRPETRLVAVTWVHSSTGVKLPIRALADALAEVNAKRSAEDRVFLAVDGVHGFGIDNVTAKDLGCDVFIAGCHKWLCGPRGTGIVWANAAAWEQIQSTIPSFEGAPFVAWMQGKTPAGPGGLMNTPGGFHSFENRWALASGFQFQAQIGRAAIQDRIHALNTRLKQGLRELPRVKLHTPLDHSLSAGINCFEVQGKTPSQVVEALHAKKILASTSPYRVSYARLSAGLLNNESQVDAAVQAVAAL